MTDLTSGSSDGLSKFKEGVTAFIAAVVVIVTMWMLAGTFLSAAFKEPSSPSEMASADLQAQQRQDKERENSLKLQEGVFNHRKDIMLYGLSLLGAIIGYYFGRVPAELHAKAAERSANNAQQQLNTTNDKLNAATANATSATQNAQQVTQQAEQLKKDVKNTLAGVKNRMASLRSASKTLSAVSSAPGTPDLDQAEREIDALLTRL
jgi:hypothetical protein